MLNRTKKTDGDIGPTQGPRFKNNATRQLESLVKAMLVDYSNHKEPGVFYDADSHMQITANNQSYDLTSILSNQPDFEQLHFTEQDISLFERMLRDKKVVWKHIDDRADESPKDYVKMANSFPNLSKAEMSAICSYTCDMFAPIYFILKYHAQNPFPNRDVIGESPFENGEVFDMFGKVYDPNYSGKTNEDNEIPYDYDPKDPKLLAPIMRELLVNTCMATFALSKNVQPEIGICVVSSIDGLKATVDKIKGISLVLIPTSHDSSLFNLCLVAYGEVKEDLIQSVNTHALFQKHHNKCIDGIKLSTDEIMQLSTQLSIDADYNQLNKLSPLLKTKLLGILMNQPEIYQLTFEQLIRVEEDPVYFRKSILPSLEGKYGSSESYIFTTSFFSTSTKLLEVFETDDVNVIMHLTNPTSYGKNIQYISNVFFERERLFIPGQQIAFTHKTIEHNDYTGHDDIHLRGYPVRSLDGIDRGCIESQRPLHSRQRLFKPAAGTNVNHATKIAGQSSCKLI